MTFGEKITKLRKENNMTQEQLADILDVTRQSISRWESCIAFPETDKIVQLSKIFNCSIDYLFKDEIVQKDCVLSEINHKKDSCHSIRNKIIFLIMLSIIIILLIILLFVVLKKQNIDRNSYENDTFILNFQDDDTIINFDKAIVNTGDTVVVSYNNDSVKIKMNMIFRIYCENSDITITCLNDFKYLNNGYYKNMNEGIYKITISIIYEKGTIIDKKANVERLSTAYNKIEFHILKYDSSLPVDQWKHDIYDLKYYEKFNHCVGKEGQELIYEDLNYVWVINELNIISKNDFIYFVIDDELIEVEFGKVLTETYKTFFKNDSKTGYIVSLENYTLRTFMIHFENGKIIFDTGY